MRKGIVCLCLALLMLCVTATASGAVLRTFTPFADLDPAAQAYMDMITAWEAQSGHVVEDYSGLMDEAWLDQMTQMARRGEADVLIVPVDTGLTAAELVTAEALQAAAPDLGVRRFESMARDGDALLFPLRISWEALYINKDVLDAHGLAVPETYEELLAVCSVLSSQGVTPIANSLCEWAEIVLDCVALASSAPEDFGGEASLTGAQQMLAALHAVGAFGSDPWNVSDMDMMEAFLSGEAAMRIDADFLAYDVPQDRLDCVIVIPMPQRTGEGHSVLAGSPSLGVGVTRACWEDDARSGAAISFLRTLMDAQYHQSVAAGVGGALGESISQMLRSATDCAGILYDRMDGDFDAWSESVIASLMEQ